jgi:predicted DNA-binding transcriptional regulator AlpA
LARLELNVYSLQTLYIYSKLRKSRRQAKRSKKMEQTQTTRFVRLSKATKEEVHFSKSTLYKWHSKGLFPMLFRMLKGTLFVDVVRLEELIDNGIRPR